MVVRLFVNDDLNLGASVVLNSSQHHYLQHVMRASEGDSVLLFNGRDGEWLSNIDELSKRQAVLNVFEKTRDQSEEKLSDVWLCFSLIKKDNLHFIVQKATELGISVLQPIITRRSVLSNVNIEKMRLQVIEAAEQSERLSIPQVNEVVCFEKMFNNWDLSRKIYFLDERSDGQALTFFSKVAYIVGPEGGFDTQELQMMRALEYATPLHFGRRILRAETACVAVLSVHNFLSGWR